MSLLGIAYTSIARPAVGYADLYDILQVARERNGAGDVTGVLLFFAGRFAQYIEGPAMQTRAIYASIQRDARHEGIVERVNEPVLQREFEGWRLAFACPEAALVDPVFIVRDLYAPATGRGHALLQSFLLAHADIQSANNR